VFVGTRVPFRNLIDYLERNHSLDEFLDSFPTVSREQAVAALEAAPRGGECPCAFCSMSNRPGSSRRTWSATTFVPSSRNHGQVSRTANCSLEQRPLGFGSGLL
jgi:hypothetical protein